MTEVKMYKPKVRQQPNGFYLVNCTIKCNDFSPQYQGKKGKIVMAEVINETELRLIFPGKNDETWKPSPYKGLGWYEKIEKVNLVTFYN